METDRKSQETDRKFQETDRKFQETDRPFKETDKKMRELQELFTGQWRKLVEALLTPCCLKVFKDAGIKIEQSCANMRSEKEGGCKIDVVLINTDELVAIEVKTTAAATHVKHFLKLVRMKKYGRFKAKKL